MVKSKENGSFWDPKDSRGNSLYTDAGLAYSNLIDYRIDRADGLDGTIYKLLGKDNVKWIAGLIDPLSKFKLSSYKVAAVNRTKKIRTGLARQRTLTTIAKSYSRSSTPVTETSDPWDYRFPGTESVLTSASSSQLTSQSVVMGFRKDTSKRSRPVGVDQGEFELFIPRLFSPSRGAVYVWNKTSAMYTVPYKPYNRSESEYSRDTRIDGPSARMSQSQLDALASSESSTADAYLNKYAYGMLANALPSTRKASLGRTIVELRDTMETIQGTLEGMISALGKNFKLSDLSSAFLNEKFGWENTISDIETLLSSPDALVAKVNYLITRQWKDTTFRSNKRFLVPLSNPPTFAYDALDSEYGNSTSTKAYSNIELRVVVNANVRFPELQYPTLNPEFAAMRLQDRLLGRTLTVSDLYRLIPWTWLGDWFESVSSYLECIETINADDSIVNYAFATYHSEIVSVTEYQASVVCSRNDNLDGVNKDSSFTLPISHSSALLATYRKRKDLATVDRVRPSWDLTKFSGTQLSILGALATAKRG